MAGVTFDVCCLHCRQTFDALTWANHSYARRVHPLTGKPTEWVENAIAQRDVASDPRTGELRYIALFKYATPTWVIGLGRYAMWGAYDDVWYFDSEYRAEMAYVNWDPGMQPEPIGWSRHPATRRRRPGGDPALEEIRE